MTPSDFIVDSSSLQSEGKILCAHEARILQKLVSDEALLKYQAGAVPHKLLAPFAEALKKISERYLGDDKNRSVRDPMEAAAYALYFGTINYVKVLRLLKHIPRPALSRPLSVLDFGAGPGTASLALADTLQSPLDITLVDASPPMRETASLLFRDCAHVKIAIHPHLPAHARYDLIFACNVINEINEDNRLAALHSLVDALELEGILVIIEPGMKETTRGLMRLRDSLLVDSPRLVPLFPCTRRDPCPMLRESEDDWCHSQLRWERPPLVRQFDELVGFNKHRLKFSSLVLQRNGMLNMGVRAVTETQRSKRGFEAILCADGLYSKITLPKKERSTSNHSFEKMKQHDLVSIAPLPSNGALSKASEVKIQSSLDD